MPHNTDRSQVIVTRLDEILDNVDLEITSQRQITNKLAEELGEDVYEHKTLIKSRIKDFLDAGCSQAQPEEADGDGAGQQPGSSSKKRKHQAEVPAACKARKTESADDEELDVDLTGSRKIKVNKFKGKLYVAIREYYNKNGEEAPGKGISLDPGQWAKLAEHIDAISQAIQDDDTDLVVKLSDLRQVSVQHYKGRLQVGIREMYATANELLPGKKGIALSIEQWDLLCQAAPDVTQAVQRQSGTQQRAESTQTASAAQKAAAASPSAAAAPAASASDAPAAAPTTAEDNSAAAQLPIQLSAMRKADISPFKGVVYVSIREYYEKNGEQLPGKKGISLPADQFAILREASAALTEALESRDQAFEVQLSGKRKASISVFKDKPMVDIREFYEKDGEQKPGAKGISLPPEQWHKLAAGFDALAAALQAQS